MHILEKLLENVNGATFISIDTETIPKLPGGKSNPDQGRVTKCQDGSNVMIFQNKKINGYEAMINRRLAKENFAVTTFNVGPRKWGTRRENCPFIDHDGHLYLEVIFLHAGHVHYKRDGVDINDFVELSPHTEGDQGGLENKVIIRTFNVENIKAITIDGKRHVL